MDYARKGLLGRTNYSFIKNKELSLSKLIASARLCSNSQTQGLRAWIKCGKLVKTKLIQI